MNGHGYYYDPTQFQGFQGFYDDSMGLKAQCLHLNSHDPGDRVLLSPNGRIFLLMPLLVSQTGKLLYKTVCQDV